jgi:hypothetical protein
MLEEVEIPLQDVHNLSVKLIDQFEAEEVKAGTATAAMMLTIGRLQSPKVMDIEDQIKFLNAVAEFTVMYFIPAPEVKH